jgi:hypothetical protein
MLLWIFISLALSGCASLIYMLAQWLREPRRGEKRLRTRLRRYS